MRSVILAVAVALLSACGGADPGGAGIEIWVELEANGGARAAAGVGQVEIIGAEASGSTSLRASYTLGKPVPPTVHVSEGCAELALFSLWTREVCAGEGD